MQSIFQITLNFKFLLITKTFILGWSNHKSSLTNHLHFLYQKTFIIIISHSIESRFYPIELNKALLNLRGIRLRQFLRYSENLPILCEHNKFSISEKSAGTLGRGLIRPKSSSMEGSMEKVICSNIFNFPEQRVFVSSRNVTRWHHSKYVMQ